jgi:replicative DNA helicase Mcm
MGALIVFRSYKKIREGRPFSVRKCILLGGVIGFNKGACYDDKTEILTRKGWKFFKDLSKDDEVASLSKDHIFYWCRPTALQKYKYKGKMIQLNHKTVNLLVTPNHKLYLREQNSKNYKFEEASKLDKYAYTTINKVNWLGEEKELFHLPKVDYHENSHGQHIEKDVIKMDHWLDFLGWYISEGSVVENSKDYIVCLKQLHKEKVLEIKRCLDNLGYNYCYTEASGSFRIYNKQLHEYLKKLGKSDDKHIPDEFMNLSTRQLKILFDSLMKGDGHISEGHTSSYYTTSKRLADQIQEITMKLGYNSAIKIRDRTGDTHLLRGGIVKGKSLSYEVSIRKSNETFMITKDVVTEKDYFGMVYCCTVPEHVILVRRNGYSTWCGNSGGGYGPLSVSGYILLGLTAATAIGTTTVAEGIACVVGFATYTVTTSLDWGLILLITCGSLIADPLSAYLNNHLKKKLDPPFHGRLIGVAMMILGLITIWRLISG